MASPQTDNGFLRVANELYEEILRRDFSKRQQNVLLFILRLSYGCQKKNCTIPKFNYFELAGLYKGDIKKELKYLRECKVLNWDEISMIFSLNKDYEFWQISPSKNFDRDRMKELISLNLKGKKVSKTLTNEGEKVSEILTNENEEVSKTLTRKLVKHELSCEEIPCESKGESLPKDSIKEKEEEEAQKSPFLFYQENFGIMTPIQVQNLEHWIADFNNNVPVINEAIKQTALTNPRNAFPFLNRVLTDWHKRGLMTMDKIQLAIKEHERQKSGRKGTQRQPAKEGDFNLDD